MPSISSRAIRPNCSRQIDGRVVEVAGGKTQRLATKDAVVEAIDPGPISRFLAVITDPNVAFILLMVGIYGLIFEFMSPGAVAPGVVGTICLLLGLYALNLLPINYAGLALMLVGHRASSPSKPSTRPW